MSRRRRTPTAAARTEALSSDAGAATSEGPGVTADEVVAGASTRRRLALFLRVSRWADRRLAGLILVTLVLAAVAGALQSLALKMIVDAAIDQRWTFAVVAAVIGGVGAGLLGSAERAMSDTEHVVANEVGHLIDRNSLELAAAIPGIEHLERPAYLDQLALVRSGGPALMRAVFTLTRTAALAISVVSSLWLLAAVHPLLLLTPLAAIPTAVLVPRSERYVDRARSTAAERQRAATQLHQLFLSPGPAMELRVFGATERLDERSDELWREVSDVELRGAVRGAAMASIGWLTLTLGYVGALLFTAHLALDGRATVGDIVLVSQLALLIRANVAMTANAAREATAALRTADRYLWLEDLRDQQQAIYSGSVPAPVRLQDGISFRGVSFTYPGTDAPVLDGVDLDLRAGSTVAVVGDNGAGKTTLVKLLTGMYRPTSGTITVDGIDLASLDVVSWRQRLSGAFQDFLRLEATVRTSVGVGDPDVLAAAATADAGADAAPDHCERSAAQVAADETIERAIERGRAGSAVRRLEGGLDAQLGRTYADGAELSGGQWQRLAVARAMMREQPLCLVLDEPTAALDPEAEQVLFTAVRDLMSGGDGEDGRGAITVLISHRFSTVRMADAIVVLDGGRIVEHGDHRQLMAAGGHYARMYRQQAEAYA
jgi:ATP-binding cassette subfamily B protein